MKQVKLTKEERGIEKALIRGEYLDIPKSEFEEIAQAIAHRRKDTVLNIRVNGEDLESIKQKARRLGIRYQAFISELLHRIAHS